MVYFPRHIGHPLGEYILKDEEDHVCAILGIESNRYWIEEVIYQVLRDVCVCVCLHVYECVGWRTVSRMETITAGIWAHGADRVTDKH